MNEITIRTERNDDFHAIASIHAETFTYTPSMPETLLVAALRGRPDYDNELSLVAERGGQVIGHALFTPLALTVRGERLQSVVLAPIAVRTAAQAQGAGSALVREGLARATAKGYACSVLLGHPDYYGRFGYRGGMWARRTVRIPYEAIPALPPDRAVARRVRTEDIEALCALWSAWHEGAALSVQPGASLTDWLSPMMGVAACVVEKGGRPAGYCRYSGGQREVLAFAAADRSAFDGMCALLAQTFGLTEGESLTLPSSPKLLELAAGMQEDVYAGREQMLAVLDPDNAPLKAYCEDAAAGRIVPGAICWPVEFDAFQ